MKDNLLGLLAICLYVLALAYFDSADPQLQNVSYAEALSKLTQ